MGLFESATVGWLGGILGGFTTNAGVIVAGSGSFVVGAAAGARGSSCAPLSKGMGAEKKPPWRGEGWRFKARSLARLAAL